MEADVMDEQTQTPRDAGASEEPTAIAPVTDPIAEEQRLERLLKRLVQGLVVLVAVFAVVYFFGQRQTPVEQALAAPQQAILNAEAAVREKPNDIELRLNLATAYARGKRVDDALAQLKEILKAQPKYRPALLGVGQLMYEKGEYAEAKSALDKYVATVGKGEFAAQDPKLEMAYYFLGQTETALGNTQAAVDAFRAAVKINPGDADAWYGLGSRSLEINDFQTALSAFDRAVAYVPTGWCEPYDGMSKAFKGLGDASGETYASAMVRICNGGGLASAEPLKELMGTKYVVGALYGLGLAAENDSDVEAALDFYQQLLSVDRANISALSAINRLGATPEPKPIVVGK